MRSLSCHVSGQLDRKSGVGVETSDMSLFVMLYASEDAIPNCLSPDTSTDRQAAATGEGISLLKKASSTVNKSAPRITQK